MTTQLSSPPHAACTFVSPFFSAVRGGSNLRSLRSTLFIRHNSFCACHSTRKRVRLCAPLSGSEGGGNSGEQRGASDDADSKDETESQQQGPEREEHQIPQSSVDWNSEWTSFRQKGGVASSGAPAGRTPVRKEVLATRRAMTRVRNRVENAIPTRQQLFADWRFWIGLILALSVFSAFINSTAGGGGAGTIGTGAPI